MKRCARKSLAKNVISMFQDLWLCEGDAQEKLHDRPRNDKRILRAGVDELIKRERLETGGEEDDINYKLPLTHEWQGVDEIKSGGGTIKNTTLG